MIELAKASIIIEAPIDAVFTYVSNMENYKEWFPGVTSIRSENNLNHKVVGKTYTETLSLPEGDIDLIIEVDKCDSNRLFLTKGNFPGILPQMKITFSTNNEGCDIDLQYYSRCLELTPTSDIIIALREDLKDRAKKGVIKLKEIMEQKRLQY